MVLARRSSGMGHRTRNSGRGWRPDDKSQRRTELFHWELTAVVEVSGIEPLTSSLRTTRSTN